LPLPLAEVCVLIGIAGDIGASSSVIVDKSEISPSSITTLGSDLERFVMLEADAACFIALEEDSASFAAGFATYFVVVENDAIGFATVEADATSFVLLDEDTTGFVLLDEDATGFVLLDEDIADFAIVDEDIASFVMVDEDATSFVTDLVPVDLKIKTFEVLTLFDFHIVNLRFCDMVGGKIGSEFDNGGGSRNFKIFGCNSLT